jgi:cell wall-associated NlpC family hydrolase
MDCSTLVHQTIVDMGLRSPGRRTEDMLASPLMEPVEEPELGDLLLRPGHVGIYIGGGQVIEAPHTGRVVSKTTYKGLGDGTQGTWTAIRRYDPQPAQ